MPSPSTRAGLCGSRVSLSEVMFLGGRDRKGTGVLGVFSSCIQVVVQVFEVYFLVVFKL